MKLSGKNLQPRFTAPAPSQACRRSYPKRILLFGPDSALRERLTTLLARNKHFELLGASDENSSISHLAKSGPDLLVLDVDAPGQRACATIRALKSKIPALKVLAITDNDHSLFAAEVLEAGADGYVLKEAGAEEMVAAIGDVANGHIYLSEELLINNAGDLDSADGMRIRAGSIARGMED